MTKLEKTISELSKAHTQLDTFAELEANAFLKSIRRAESHVYRRVVELLVKYPFNPGWAWEKKIQWHLERWSQIERIALREYGGYTEAVKTYLAGYKQMAGLAEKMLEIIPRGERVAAEFTRIPSEWITFVKKDHYNFFSFLNERGIKELDEVVKWNLLGGRSRSGMLQELKGKITGSYPWGEKTGLYEWHAGSYARTKIHQATRTWMAAKAKEQDLEHYIYIGPTDAKVRPFCAQIVGGAYTRQEIESMDNGQTGNVLVDGGGYNCRHEFIPVDKDFAEEVKEEMAAEAV